MQDAYTISDQSPTLVIPAHSFYPDVQLTNDGLRRVYLGTDSTVSVATGYPLDPGSNKDWTTGEGSGLWVISDPVGVPATPLPTLRLITNTGGIFNPTAISNALILGGLAQGIATAIRIEGVPPIDEAAVLYNDTVNVALAATFDSPIIDVSRYNSASIYIRETNGVAGSCFTPRHVYLFTYADAAGLQFMDGRRMTYFPSGGGILVSPSMTRGPYFRIRLSPALGVGAAIASVEMRVTGTMRSTGTLERVELMNMQVGGGRTVLSGDPGLWLSSSAAWAVGGNTEYPETYAGPATISWDVGPLTAVGYFRLYDQLSGVPYFSETLPVSVSTQRGSKQIYLPERATRFYYFNANVGVVSATFALTMEGNR
jgi:hypothetical protein